MKSRIQTLVTFNQTWIAGKSLCLTWWCLYNPLKPSHVWLHHGDIFASNEMIRWGKHARNSCATGGFDASKQQKKSFRITKSIGFKHQREQEIMENDENEHEWWAGMEWYLCTLVFWMFGDWWWRDDWWWWWWLTSVGVEWFWYRYLYGRILKRAMGSIIWIGHHTWVKTYDVYIEKWDAPRRWKIWGTWHW